jgi:acyl-CoA synthetase (AMP-forming)/AMP-acid ligase II
MLIHQFLETNAAKYPDNDALIHLDQRIGYAELDRNANHLANFFVQSGIKPGDRIGILLEPSIDYAIAYFAILKAGGVVVGLNTATTARIVRGLLSDCAASAIVVQHQFAHFVSEIADDCPSLKLAIVDGQSEELSAQTGLTCSQFDEIQQAGNPSQPNIERSGLDLATIIYTSGTTGNPKGVMLSHRNLEANTDSIVEYLHLTSTDKVMAVLPFYYSYGHSLLLTHIRVGGSLVVDNRFAYPNVILDIMSKEKVTGFSGVPSTFAILLYRSNFPKYKWDHLRYVTQAGGPMTPALTSKLMETIPHIKIYVMYGQTEASARLSYLEPDMLLKKLGSIGKAIPDVTLTVRDENGNICPPGIEGEIVASGDNIMLGYWNQPEETAKILKVDGLHTGDLAKTDENGFIYIVGRNSEMIKSGAHRISPKEIEVILEEHQAVLESAVVGVPDEIMGESIKAVVVLKDECNVTERDIIKHCSLNLPPFKVPKKVEFIKSLPKTTSGKIMRHLLRTTTNSS